MKAAGVRRDSPRAVTILMKMDRPKKRFPFCTRVRKPKLALPRPTRTAPMMMARLEPRTWIYCADCPVSIPVCLCMVMICLAKYRCEDERGDEDSDSEWETGSSRSSSLLSKTHLEYKRKGRVRTEQDLAEETSETSREFCISRP